MFATIKMLSLKRRARKLERRVAAYEAQLDEKRRSIALYTLATIGGLSLLWAKLEAKLDHINELAFLNGAKDVIDAEIPRALDRKLDFMSRSHGRLSWLHSLRPDALKISAQFKSLRKDRHQLIHGVVEGLDTDDVLKFVRHIHGSGPLGIDVQEFTSERFVGLVVGMADLSKLVHQHHSAMNSALLQHHLDQIKR